MNCKSTSGGVEADKVCFQMFSYEVSCLILCFVLHVSGLMDVGYCNSVENNYDEYLLSVFNPRRTCTARVMVLGLCVCQCVCVCLSPLILALQAPNKLMSEILMVLAQQALEN